MEELEAEELPSYFGEPPAPPAPRHRAPTEHRSASGRSAHPNPLPLQSLYQFRPAEVSVNFLRVFDVPFEVSLAAIERWWHQEACQGAVEVRRSRLIGPPRHDGHLGECQVGVELARGWAVSALRMELDLFPWFETFGTKLGLYPRRAVRPSRRYFEAGHAVLDGVIAGLTRYAG